MKKLVVTKMGEPTPEISEKKRNQHTIVYFIIIVYSVIKNDCRGFNNLSYTIHLR